MRFIALVRALLQGQVTKEEALKMSIGQGLDRLAGEVRDKCIILDLGCPITSGDQVRQLFEGLKQLWNRFSQIPNADQRVFLDYFECQQVTTLPG